MSGAIWAFVLVSVVGVLYFRLLGLYRIVVRYMGATDILALGKAILLLALMIWAAAFLLNWPYLPRSVPAVFALTAFVFVGGSRLAVKYYYQWLLKHYVDKEAVLIYGAGGAGVQLASALVGGREIYPVGFIDDDTALQKGTVKGLKVYAPEQLPELISGHSVTSVLLALPGIASRRKKEILESLEPLPVHVRTVPSMPEIVSGTASVEQLREIDLEDLLGRDPVPPRKELQQISVGAKVVMITGAGGSIGSELCRQVMLASPSLLILFEQSEYALYQIEQSLAQMQKERGTDIAVIPLLGSVCDELRVEAVLQRFKVQTIYHAAAYKHVPIVEHNVLQGVQNNVFGTRIVADLAARYNVERFVLVSTDKAVRPTNVMGATKRLAEIVLQDLALKSDKTIFSMVRFGNVLGSSGSVVPLFRRQIQEGGPVTVTHPDITRFFMTIPEAASLVVQAGSMGQGGDVFVLNMGEPVRISDLALKMIHLTGRTLRSEDSPAGDIEIKYSGLRPGEKLYEELLIGEDVVGTEHPKIMRAHEEIVPAARLQELLTELEQVLCSGDSQRARSLLQQSVSGFQPSSELVDLLEDGVVVH
ncbi:polysaccharide biosynthesis protein [Marinobacterium jannaschii]|uniref:polysaccharide biosynthesis protein n=1 Tax=Marinobacterium jannaschii TaxID=64970 RepID=UPI001FDEBBAE|nr:nucleoside-diphosphate sugar epimerase/dehydratase [Marinobacterium jannaschii]